MDIERLKELREETDQYRAVADDRCMSTSYEDDLLALIDAEIARQSETEKVVCPDCNGSGVYREYDEYDRYYVHACGKCDGSGEIARQSATSEEVQEAVEYFNKSLEYRKEHEKETRNHYGGELPTWQDEMNKHDSTAITALQAYQPWISVEDRLPVGNVASVLIYTNDGGVAEGQYYPCIKAWKQFRWSAEDANVTHWKPLPEPPKENEHGGLSDGETN